MCSWINKSLLKLVVSIKENIDASTATGRLMLKMISAINDCESEHTLER
ncbi:recombinase family protein [Bacillus mycoides]